VPRTAYYMDSMRGVVEVGPGHRDAGVYRHGRPGAYTATYQPRIVKESARALGIATLMLSTLLLAQLTGLASGPALPAGHAPTLLSPSF